MKAKILILSLALATVAPTHDSAAWNNALLIEGICEKSRVAINHSRALISAADFSSYGKYSEKAATWFMQLVDDQDKGSEDICQFSKEPYLLNYRTNHYKVDYWGGMELCPGSPSPEKNIINLFIDIMQPYFLTLSKINYLSTPVPVETSCRDGEIQCFIEDGENCKEVLCGDIDGFYDGEWGSMSSLPLCASKPETPVELPFDEHNITATLVPTGFNLRKGEITVSYPREGYLLINQTSDFAIATWEHFSIGRDAIVKLITPSPDAITVLYGSDIYRSYYFGSLISNSTIHIHASSGSALASSFGVPNNFESEDEMATEKNRFFRRMHKGSVISGGAYIDYEAANYPTSISEEMEKEFIRQFWSRTSFPRSSED